MGNTIFVKEDGRELEPLLDQLEKLLTDVMEISLGKAITTTIVFHGNPPAT